MTGPIILIPAAGASGRMRGTDKLLEHVNGEPLLARQIRVAEATGASVIVTLPVQSPRRAVVPHRISVLELPGASEGMAASLRAGAVAAGDAPGMLILLADMPALETTDLLTLLRCFANDPGRIFRATSEDGMPGHPVILPCRLFDEVLRLRGDTGAKEILRRHKALIEEVPLPGRRAITDLDTPEDWAAWRAGS